MIGAIAGDIIGSIYEMNNIKTKDFPLFTNDKHFTDDTVLTIATIDKLLNKKRYTDVYQQYAKRFPDAGYGKKFKEWFNSPNPEPYGSFANGSAMRVSPIGLFHPNYGWVLDEAKYSSIVTHNHPEAIKAAECVAAAVWFASKNEDKTFLKDCFEKFGYDMSFDLMELKKTYVHDVTAKGTMPVALKSFLESTDYEDCIRLSVSIGGDTDTIACIAGAIAEAYYKKIPKFIIVETLRRLPEDFRSLLYKYYSVAEVNTLANNDVLWI